MAFIRTLNFCLDAGGFLREVDTKAGRAFKNVSREENYILQGSQSLSRLNYFEMTTGECELKSWI